MPRATELPERRSPYFVVLQLTTTPLELLMYMGAFVGVPWLRKSNFSITSFIENNFLFNKFVGLS